MQYDDGADRTTDPDANDEPVVGEQDEQADATDPRGGSDEVWQGVQPVEGSEAVSDDPVTEDIDEDTHPTNIQPVTPDLGGVQPVDPDLGGVQPVDPDLGTGEPVDDSSGTDTPEDPDADTTTADARVDQTDAVAPEPDADTTIDEPSAVAAAAGAVGGTAAAAGPSEPAARTDGDDPLRARWHEAQHLFVDNPAGAVHQAAALVQEAAERAMSATHAESGTDHGTQYSPDTERLRITMQNYHEAFDSLIRISSGDPA